MHRLYLSFVFVVVTLPLLLVGQNKTTRASAPTNPAFEKIKTLAGDWETKTPEGKVLPTSFRLVSAGSAVLVNTAEPNGAEMITVIHPDGAGVMATHYCTAKNQPRLVLVSSQDPNQLVFKLKDITNLSSPDAGHIDGLVITLVSADRHTEAWTWSEGGKEEIFTMQFTRKL